MNRLFFGTDGIRGPYGGELINELFAYRLGQAVGKWLSSKQLVKQAIILGRDTRRSGVMLIQALIKGLNEEGLTCEDLGVVPTPFLARILREKNSSFGIMVTASHNPASDNGFKCLGMGGRKLSELEEKELELLLSDLLNRSSAKPAFNTPQTFDYCLQSTLLSQAYFDALKALLPLGLKGWKISIDTAHGATWQTTPCVLRELQAEVFGLGDKPNGANINLECGSEYPQTLMQQVVATGSRLGIAHDGDGDRCILCDELGHNLDGDEILAILATDLLADNLLHSKTLITTVHSNLGLDFAIKKAGGHVLRTAVGDRHVAEAMVRVGSNLGGESSGHIISPAVSPTGDGAAAALQVIKVMQKTGKKLSELRRIMHRVPHAYLTIPVKEKKPIIELKRLQSCIIELETKLGEDGLVLVRFSGTEPKLRLMVQARDLLDAEAGLKALVLAAQADLA